MNPNRMIHETVVRDIIDLYDMIKNDGILNFKNNKLSKMKSIADASSELTLTFPVLGSRALSIDSLAMVTKAQERKCCTMLQMLFSAVQISDAGDAYSYLSQFHNNLSTKFFTADDAIEIASRFGESASTVNSIKRLKETARLKELEKAVQDDNLHNTSWYLPENISEHSINDFRLVKTLYENCVVLEKNNNTESKEYNDYWKNKDERDKIEHSRRLDKDERDKIEHSRRLDKYDDDRNLAISKMNVDDTASKLNTLKGYEIMYNFNKNQLLDSDVRKANELMPTMLNVAFKTKTEEGFETIDNVVCGVKCKLYPVESNDVIDRIKTKHYNKNFILGLVKSSTREISFWKDLILAIDRAKLDAISYSRKNANSKLWKVLERRAAKSRIRRLGGNVNNASAISTLAISQNEVEYLRKEDNIDLEKIEVVRNVMEAYNLMSVVIVDEDLEVCKFIYDTGDDLWESVSFTHLERESSDNTYKRIVNMMTKMR